MMTLESTKSSHASTGHNASTKAVSRAMLDGLAAQRTMHHRGIEAYRRTAHTLVDPVSSDGDTPSTAGVDAHCDALHDIVDDSWSLYTTLLADGIQLAGTALETGRHVGGQSPSPPADLEAIDGIGTAYADQLRALGIDTVADLADADPAIEEDLDAIGVDVDHWIAQAVALTSAD